MGCDIHSVAQVRKNNNWTTVAAEIAGDNRNYNTFACLANVRNGYGFAGSDTGDGFIPIAQPRGLPRDFTIEREYHPLPNGVEHPYDADERSLWMGDHSHSWLLLSELEEYFERHAKSKSMRRAFVSEEEFKQIYGTNRTPEVAYGLIGGKDVLCLSARDYHAREEPIPEGAKVYVQYAWQVTYEEVTKLKEIIDELRKIASQNAVTKEDVRYVFGFDS